MSYFYFIEVNDTLANKVIEYCIHECSLNGKDNDLSYYFIHLEPFYTS